MPLSNLAATESALSALSAHVSPHLTRTLITSSSETEIDSLLDRARKINYADLNQVQSVLQEVSVIGTTAPTLVKREIMLRLQLLQTLKARLREQQDIYYARAQDNHRAFWQRHIAAQSSSAFLRFSFPVAFLTDLKMFEEFDLVSNKVLRLMYYVRQTLNINRSFRLKNFLKGRIKYIDEIRTLCDWEKVLRTERWNVRRFRAALQRYQQATQLLEPCVDEHSQVYVLPVTLSASSDEHFRAVHSLLKARYDTMRYMLRLFYLREHGRLGKDFNQHLFFLILRWRQSNEREVLDVVGHVPMDMSYFARVRERAIFLSFELRASSNDGAYNEFRGEFMREVLSGFKCSNLIDVSEELGIGLTEQFVLRFGQIPPKVGEEPLA